MSVSVTSTDPGRTDPELHLYELLELIWHQLFQLTTLGAGRAAAETQISSGCCSKGLVPSSARLLKVRYGAVARAIPDSERRVV